MTLDELRALITALETHGVEYVVIGAAALNALGIVRATEDIDIMVRPSADNVARLRRALGSLWDDPDIAQITAEDLAGAYPAVRYGPPQGSLYIDIVARFGEAFAFDDVPAESVDIGGVHARIATPRALYLMKRGTVREIDRLDAARLRARFGLDEE
jgi:hypothetical protein